MDDRRKFLQAIALAILATLSPQTATADDENPANEMRPQTGDLFVSEDDEKKIISPNDLWLNQQPLEAFPYDPKNKIVRDGSRLNRVLLVKLDLKTLGETTRERAAPDGIVAYSGICTHQGCPVTGWINDQGTQVMKCFCHNSEYDTAHGAQDGEVRHWANGVSGAKALATDGDHVLLAGGYGDEAGRIALLHLDDEQAQQLGELRLQPPQRGAARLVQGHGATLHIVEQGRWAKLTVAAARAMLEAS
jgi:rieske iron-sulfur protein